MKDFDPRTVITPDSFSVAPELLGLPLAGPWRRLWAMLLDLVPVAILAGAGPVIFVAFFLAILVWRAIATFRPSSLLGRAGVGMSRLVLAVLAFVFVLQVGERIQELARSDERDAAAPTPANLASPDSLEAFIARAAGAEAAAQFAEALDRTEPQEAHDTALSPAARDSIALRYAAAIEERDRLRGRVRDLRTRVDELENQLEEAQQPPTVRAVLFGLADDLGIGFGWGALYFTVLLTLGGGRTPGKRLAGVRVVRLDGKPMSWWYSFERFGGYFACLTTGLLGFAQILWDRNRQGLHDKIVETVVVREPRKRAAGPMGRAPALVVGALMMPTGLVAQTTTTPCSDTVRVHLDPFVGTFEVRALFRTASAAWDTTDARTTIQRELDGCLLREHYIGTRFGESFEYVALWGANGWDGARIQRTAAHSRHGILSLRAGSFHGDTLILEERYPLRGQQVIAQDLFTRPDASGFSLIARRSTDGGTTWDVTLRARFRRTHQRNRTARREHARRTQLHTMNRTA